MLWGLWKPEARLLQHPRQPARRQADAGPPLPMSIGALELYPLLLLELLAGDLLAGLFWQAQTDNLGNVFSVLKGHTDDTAAQPYLTALLGLTRRQTAPGQDPSGTGGHMLVMSWLPREFNELSDDGSKSSDAATAMAVAAMYLKP